MDRLIKLANVLLYLILLAVLYAVTVDKHDFMYEMDPSLPRDSIVTDASGGVAAGVVLAVVLLMQMGCLLYFRTMRWKITSVILAALAVVFYAIR